MSIAKRDKIKTLRWKDSRLAVVIIIKYSFVILRLNDTMRRERNDGLRSDWMQFRRKRTYRTKTRSSNRNVCSNVKSTHDGASSTRSHEKKAKRVNHSSLIKMFYEHYSEEYKSIVYFWLFHVIEGDGWTKGDTWSKFKFAGWLLWMRARRKNVTKNLISIRLENEFFSFHTQFSVFKFKLCFCRVTRWKTLK